MSTRIFCMRGFAVPIFAVFVSSILIPPSPARAQDAFNSLGDCGDDTGSYDYPAVGDSFSSTGQRPQLQGWTHGTITPYREKAEPVETAEQKLEKENISTITGEGVRIRADEYRKATRLPSSRALLGLSFCDLSYRPIVCDEVKQAADMPPLPKQITLPSVVSELQISSDYVPGSSFDAPPQPAQSFMTGLIQSASNVLPPPLEMVVKASDVEELSNANYAAACNPDFGSRFAAYCMELEHTGRVPAHLKDALDDLKKLDNIAPAPFRVMAKLKMAIATIEPSRASASERAALADRMERDGLVYEALVERLRCVDLLDDGPSRLQLAKLYSKLNEPKLAFETLRDAAQKTWPVSQSSRLAEVHFLMGKYIAALSKTAQKNGNTNLSMVRLQNASACFRRTVCIDRSNREAVLCLIQVAKEGVVLSDTFDNQLMLGGAYLLAGDFERAKAAYEICESKNHGDLRLKKARAVLLASQKQTRSTDLVSLR